MKLNDRCQGEGGTLTSVNNILLYGEAKYKYFTLKIPKRFANWWTVPQAGIEPTTLALGVLCSVHLSYWGGRRNYTPKKAL